MSLSNFKTIPNNIHEFFEYHNGKLFWKVKRQKAHDAYVIASKKFHGEFGRVA
jgi:hypothetical protein